MTMEKETEVYCTDCKHFAAYYETCHSPHLGIRKDYIKGDAQITSWSGHIDYPNHYGTCRHHAPKTNFIDNIVNFFKKLTSGYKNLVKMASNKKYKLGYIDREGKFYRCEHEAHGDLAHYLFDKSERDLDEMGWIKIGGSERDGYYAVCDKRITQEQYNTLNGLDHLPHYHKEKFQITLS